MKERGTRTLVMGVPDWPLVAAGIPPEEAAVVLRGNRVRTASAAARAEGVRVGLRRREAQARCPQVRLVPDDPSRDVRELEPLVAGVTELCPQLAVIRPGWCGFPTRGPSRYFGGDEALALRVLQVTQDLVGGRGAVRVGVADGQFAAELAADGTPAAEEAGEAGVDEEPVVPVVVPAGTSASWLAPQPVAVLAGSEGPVPAELVDLLSRLGLRTLGAVATVPVGDLVARFGPVGTVVHRLASGLDDQPLQLAPPPVELAVETTFDPPVERADQVIFAAQPLAEKLHRRLWARGEVCTQLVVVVETDHGERLERRWRHDASLTAGDMAERVRWQLGGWLQGPPATRPTAGIVLLRLLPEEVVAATGTQLRLWDSDDPIPSDRAIQAVARLGGLLGAEAVRVPEWRGSRHPGEQAVTVPAEAVDLTGQRAGSSPPGEIRDPDQPPWPGRLPAPSPAVVLPETERQPVEVVDDTGATVRVDGRAALSAPPVEVSIGGRRRPIVGWAGPWPVTERWWEPAGRRHQARFQVATDDGSAYLLVLEKGRWMLAAIYN